MPNKLYRTPDTYDWAVFRRNLLKLMESHGYNMSELALKADLNVTSISRYLQGRIPDLIAIWRIADHFGVSIDWLVGRSTKYDRLTEEQQDVIDKFSATSPSDKEIVKLFLSKYE